MDCFSLFFAFGVLEITLLHLLSEGSFPSLMRILTCLHIIDDLLVYDCVVSSLADEVVTLDLIHVPPEKVDTS